MSRFVHLLFMILLVMPFGLGLRAMAQDVPPVGVTPEVTATAAPAPNVTVNVDPGAAPAPDRAVSIPELLIGIIVAFFAGGATIGTPLTLVLLNMTAAQKDAAEKLFLSQPPSYQERERTILTTLTTMTDQVARLLTFFGKGLKVAEEITDGLPNQDSPPTSATDAGLNPDGSLPLPSIPMHWTTPGADYTPPPAPPG